MLPPEKYYVISPYYAGFPPVNLSNPNQSASPLLKERERFELFFETLPGEIKNLLLSMETAVYLHGLGQENELDEFETARISRIVRQIATGELFFGNMPVALAEELDITEESAKKLSDKLLRELLTSALEDIKKIQIEKFGNQLGGMFVRPVPQIPSFSPKSAPSSVQSPNFPRQPAVFPEKRQPFPDTPVQPSAKNNIIDLRNKLN